jgi:hypothetical protein
MNKVFIFNFIDIASIFMVFELFYSLKWFEDTNKRVLIKQIAQDINPNHINIK